MIETDRTAIITYQRCPREYWLSRKACGKGLQKKAKGLPLVVGSAFHAGAEQLLQGDIETAVYRAIKFLHDAFSAKGVGMDGEESSDASLVYSAHEQMALAEGLIRGWGLERLPEFLQTFEVLEVEKEGRATLTTVEWESLGEGGINSESELVLMFRPDALVRERLSGDYYTISWKTTAKYDKRTLKQARHAMQSVSEIWGRLHSDNPPPQIEGNVYLFAVKGKHQQDDWDQLYKNQTHLIYAWRKLKPVDEFDDVWSWTFKWAKEDGSGNSTLGKGWKRVPVWSEYPGGTKAWIEALHDRQVFPRHIDPFESVFPQSLPVERNQQQVSTWKRQTIAQELRVEEHVKLVRNAVSPEDEQIRLDIYFPQYWHSCDSYSGCQFTEICHEGIPAEPGELYQLRVSNHPEGGDED